MKKNFNKIISEKEIIYKYLKKLNFNKKESFDFRNDGAILISKKNKQLVVTNDSIVESIDFFKDDDPESIAQKIMIYNLSDLSAMGAVPYSYTLSLSLPEGIQPNWIKKFTKKLFILQKKYKIFLIGGDISKSKEIIISGNFYGYVKKNTSIKREFSNVGDSIWITGNVGDSKIGLMIKKKQINISKNYKNYFLRKYFFPQHSTIGNKLINIANTAIDVSDGFCDDLSKLIDKKNGANLFFSKIPFSPYTKILIKKNLIDPFQLLNAGDDYQLIFTTPSKYDTKIISIAENTKCKISKIGTIIDRSGLYLDGKKMLNHHTSYQYLF